MQHWKSCVKKKHWKKVNGLRPGEYDLCMTPKVCKLHHARCVPLLSSPGHFAEQLEGSGNREGARLPWLTQPWLAAARGSPAGQHASRTPLCSGAVAMAALDSENELDCERKLGCVSLLCSLGCLGLVWTPDLGHETEQAFVVQYIPTQHFTKLLSTSFPLSLGNQAMSKTESIVIPQKETEFIITSSSGQGYFSLCHTEAQQWFLFTISHIFPSFQPR